MDTILCKNHGVDTPEIVEMTHTLQANWELDPRRMPLLANQVLLQSPATLGSKPESVLLTLGHVNPPLLQAPVTEEALRNLTSNPVMPVGYFNLPMDLARRLHAQLAEYISAMESEPESIDMPEESQL